MRRIVPSDKQTRGTRTRAGTRLNRRHDDRFLDSDGVLCRDNDGERRENGLTRNLRSPRSSGSDTGEFPLLLRRRGR